MAHITKIYSIDLILQDKPIGKKKKSNSSPDIKSDFDKMNIWSSCVNTSNTVVLYR